jgi:hypothetical protein
MMPKKGGRDDGLKEGGGEENVSDNKNPVVSIGIQLYASSQREIIKHIDVAECRLGSNDKARGKGTDCLGSPSKGCHKTLCHHCQGRGWA